MKCLLDTCTFIWLTSEPKSLSELARKSIEDSEALLLSDVSVWEICLKWQSGKIVLPRPPRDWCEEQIEIWNLQHLEIRRNHLFRVTELPVFHKDPFDRLLVAQALEERVTIVTPDHFIRQYPVSVVW